MTNEELLKDFNTDDKRIANSEIKELLVFLQDHNVTEFEGKGLKIKLLPKVDLPSLKNDLSRSQKTKEQEAEEILFYSAGR